MYVCLCFVCACVHVCLYIVRLYPQDILAKARTGSGKTAAYAIPVLQKVLERKKARNVDRVGASSSGGSGGSTSAVVLVPTKELVEQVHQNFEDLRKYMGNSVTVLSLAADVPLKQQK